jgi:tetratricopeptide (TPR) repeat protein
MTTKFTIGLFVVAFIGLAAQGARAQMFVTTLGATDARQCYENASSEFSSDTDPCDRAIRDNNTLRGDKLKTFVNRGIIHNRNGDLNAAVADFNKALDGDSGLAEAYLNRGNSWFFSNQLDKALADYEQSLALRVSKSWAAWYNIGLVYEAKNQPDKAREAFEQSLALNPEFSLARAKLGNG